MSCRCGSIRVASVTAYCSWVTSVVLGAHVCDGYIPAGMGIGGDHDIQFDWCLDCGQMQRCTNFPLPPCVLEIPIEPDPPVEDPPEDPPEDP